jgi:hypothetical protein
MQHLEWKNTGDRTMKVRPECALRNRKHNAAPLQRSVVCCLLNQACDAGVHTAGKVLYVADWRDEIITDLFLALINYEICIMYIEVIESEIPTEITYLLKLHSYLITYLII